MLTFSLQNALESFGSLFLVWCDMLLKYENDAKPLKFRRKPV